ncbi:MAG: WD40 repeat domain-containing serine/threonine-protein kinase [Lysobacterales bacterium]
MVTQPQGITTLLAPFGSADDASRNLARLAELGFGSVGPAGSWTHGQHLALLSTESLELDLDDPAQRRIGDYELLELLGEGGMGVVYRARQVSLDREVAVKLLSAGPWASKDFIARFEREAQNAARMQHPNIVTVYEVGSFEGLQYFSMRLVPGESLAAWLHRAGRPAPKAVAALMRTVAEAVAYAHSLGVLHLDLKPANVLLDATGTPYVADFGLARRLENALALENDEVSGTPSYMAPEQAQVRASKLTTATDIWGLGAILYELATGQPPFHADSAQDTVKQVLEGDLRAPRRVRPDVPLDLEAIVLRCLARNPVERYPSARALADDLQRFVDGRPVQARPLNAAQRIGRWARREPKLATAAVCALAAMLIGLAATTHQWRRADSNATLAASNADLANERLWQARLDQAEGNLRNGQPYSALPELAANISEREARGLDASDDRLRYAMVARSAPRLIDVLTLGTDVFGIALSPDGKLVAVGDGDSKMRLFDTADGRQRWITPPADLPHVFRSVLVSLQFTPDGKRILGHGFWGGAALELVSPIGEFEVLFDTATGKQLLPSEAQFPRYYDAVFSPDGDYAIVQGKDETVALMRTSDWTLASPRVPMPRQSWRVGNGGRFVVSLATDFRELQVRDPRTLQVRYSHTYDAAQKVSAWATSPDGKVLLLGHADGLIESLDLARSQSERVMPAALSRVGWVTFSPDGRWFGATSDTGEVLVWDTSTRRPVSPVLHIDAGLGRHQQRLRLDAAHRRVIASNGQQMALWSIGEHTPRRISGEFPHARPGMARAFDLGAGDLVATGGDEGQLRLWRLPPDMPQLTAPVMPDAGIGAADGIVAAIEGNAVRLVHVRDGTTAGVAITLPQQPAFAGRTADGRTLVAAAGSHLYVYGLPGATLRFAPIALPNDPVRVVLSPDSRHAYVAYGDYRNGRAVDVASIRDLASGSEVSGGIAMPPCDALEYAPDGGSLLTCGVLRDPMSLQPRWTYRRADDDTPEVIRMRYAADSTQVLVLAVGKDGQDYLLHLDAETGTQRWREPLLGIRKAANVIVLPDGHSLVVQRNGAVGPAIWRAGRPPVFGAVLDVDQTSAMALAPDGRSFARGTANGVVLTSARDARWLTPDPPAASAASDPTMMLAYTYDGNGVVGRSRRGNWLYWNAAADDRPAADLLRLAHVLQPSSEDLQRGGAAVPISSAERAALRRADDGPAPPASASAPIAIPRRQPGLSPLLFDLTANYNRPMAAEQSGFFDIDLSGFVPGVHRLLGIDYDARGVITLVQQQPHASGLPARIAGIRPGVPRFAALNVLVNAQTMLRTQAQVPYAFVELDYRDGSRARLPIIYNRDIKEWWRTDWDTPGRIAWRLRDFANAEEDPSEYPSLVVVRLVNPHPGREVASLALEAVPMQFSAPAFVAITAEPSKE